MGGLASLVRESRPDALVVWPVSAALVGAAARFLSRGQPEWTAFALLTAGTVLLPQLLTRDPTVAFPGELVALVALPVALRAAGLFPQATPFVAVSGLALLGAISMEAFTSLELTPRFAVVLTTMTTMAFAGLWAVALWVVDPFVGAALLVGETELMWDLTTASAMGVVAGVVFEGYLRYTDRLAHLRTADTGVDEARRDPVAIVSRVDHEGNDVAVRGMQALLALVTAVALVRTNWKLAVNTAIPLAVTFLPAALRREYGYSMNHWLVLWLTFAAVLHAFGTMGLYRTVGWYDSLAHVVSASLVAVVGYAVARSAELHTDHVSFTPAFRGAFVFLFALAAGVGWELLEFTGSQLGTVTGRRMLIQYGVADIAKDLIFDGIGGLVVVLWSTGRLANVARVATEFVTVLVERE